jgi:hypothetical protein
MAIYLFICGIFEKAISSLSDCEASDGRMVNELERIWKEAYPGICLERLRKTTENLYQDSWSPVREFDLGLPEYEAVLPT